MRFANQLIATYLCVHNVKRLFTLLTLAVAAFSAPSFVNKTLAQSIGESSSGSVFTPTSTDNQNLVSPNIVISEVYGGGGNAGAQYNRDFIELYCRSAAPCDLNGYSVQYSGAASVNFQIVIAFTTSTIIQPGRYFLIAAGPAPGATGSNLPTADATTTNTGLNLSATSGNVALVNQTTALGTTCPDTSTVGDKVAYGSGTCREGTASAPTGSNTTSLQRSPSGSDSDQNSTDFTAAAPTPQNSTAVPTAATVSVGGRVVSFYGRGIAKIWVVMIDGEGNYHYTLTNSFGYYRFVEVPVGQTYMFEVVSKRHTFAQQTQVINVTEELDSLNFTALP